MSTIQSTRLQPLHWKPLRIAALASILTITGCATTEVDGPARKEIAFAMTSSNQLISFNAGQPRRLLSKKPVTGLQPNETVVGIDYRVAKGQLYAVGSSSRLYIIDTAAGSAKQVGSGTFAVALSGTEFGVDFNPVADRIRVVSNRGQNMRLHPETGVVVDSDPAKEGTQTDGSLEYVSGDLNFGKVPGLVAAGYTYNKTNEKLTTNYAIDGRYGTLVTQGTQENVTPAISPNTGRLFTVGSLGIGSFERASFDIADLSGDAFLAVSSAGEASSRLYQVDLKSGKATRIGTIGAGEVIVGMAIEP